MLTKQDIVNRLKSRVMNLYKAKINELRDLKASEMLAVAECLNIIYEFERYYKRDLND